MKTRNQKLFPVSMRYRWKRRIRKNSNAKSLRKASGRCSGYNPRYENIENGFYEESAKIPGVISYHRGSAAILFLTTRDMPVGPEYLINEAIGILPFKS